LVEVMLDGSITLKGNVKEYDVKVPVECIIRQQATWQIMKFYESRNMCSGFINDGKVLIFIDILVCSVRLEFLHLLFS
jgi:hypothetical protein